MSGEGAANDANTDEAVKFTADSADINGQKKTVTLDPTTVTLLDDKGQPVETVVVKGQGSYALNADKTAVASPLKKPVLARPPAFAFG